MALHIMMIIFTADNQSECNLNEKTVENNTEKLGVYTDWNPDWEYVPIEITVDDIYEGEDAFIEVHTANFINKWCFDMHLRQL